MFEKGSHILTVYSIPEMHCIIGSRRDDLPAIGRPRQGINGAVMTLIGDGLSPHSRIKNIDLILATATCQARSIGRPRQRGYGFIRLGIPETSVTDVGK